MTDAEKLRLALSAGTVLAFNMPVYNASNALRTLLDAARRDPHVAAILLARHRVISAGAEDLMEASAGEVLKLDCVRGLG